MRIRANWYNEHSKAHLAPDDTDAVAIKAAPPKTKPILPKRCKMTAFAALYGTHRCPAKEGLDYEIRDHTPVVRMHAWTAIAEKSQRLSRRLTFLYVCAACEL